MPGCTNLTKVLGFAVPSRPYELSAAFTAGRHPTAWGLERRRRRRARKADPANSAGIASAGASLHESRTPWPYAANHCASKRGLLAVGRQSQARLAESHAFHCCGFTADAPYHG